MNFTITITGKQQVTLPASILRELGLKKGDILRVEKQGNKIILEQPYDILDELGGSLKTEKPFPSDEVMQEAIAKHFKERYASKLR